MKKSITYNEPLPYTDEHSTNADALKRAVQFHLLALAKADESGVEGKMQFADFMYEVVRPMSVEDLLALVYDLQNLIEGTKLFASAVVSMLAAKIGAGPDVEVPSATEVRAKHRARTGKEL